MLDPDICVPFDLETTGIDPHTDRIVSWALRGHERLVDPGVPIPDGAAAVHGITDVMMSWARRHRLVQTPAVALRWIMNRLNEMAQRGEPVVGVNLAFDLTMLHAEAARRGVPVPEALADLLVVDVYVIDKHYDPVRPGRRRLVELARHYLGAELGGAHGAAADAAAAAAVWRAQIDAYGLNGPDVGALDYRALHDSQKHWYAHQKRTLATWHGRMGRPFLYDTCWPACPGPEGHDLKTPPAYDGGGSVPGTSSWDDIPSRERTRT